MSNIKPLGDDVLLQFKTSETTNLTKGGIYVKDDDSNTDFQYYDVKAVGPDVSSIKPGDVVMVSWARMTPPFTHEGEKYGVTSEKEIWAIVEL